MDHSSSADTSAAACKISMLWNWFTIDACFLSSSWHITSHGAFAATCIGVVLMVVLLEVLRRVGKEYDEHIQREFAARVALLANAGAGPAAGANSAAGYGSATVTAACPARGSAGVGVGRPEEGSPLLPQTVTFRASPLQQFVRAVIHTATFGLAYLIMLLAMYYNGYIIISILIGALLGKFLCDWMTRTVVIGALGDGVVKSGNGAAAGIEEPTVCCG